VPLRVTGTFGLKDRIELFGNICCDILENLKLPENSGNAEKSSYETLDDEI
jgi:hypothetical protein